MRLSGNMLRRKMFRDIKKNLSQFITIFLMITIGIMVYTTMLSYSGAMQKSGDKYYKENNLFDLEAHGTNYKQEDLDKITCLRKEKCIFEQKAEEKEQYLRRLLKSELILEKRIRKVSEKINKRNE